RGLSAVAAHLDAGDAARAATALLQAINDGKGLVALQLARTLSALLSHVPPAEMPARSATAAAAVAFPAGTGHPLTALALLLPPPPPGAGPAPLPPAHAAARRAAEDAHLHRRGPPPRPRPARQPLLPPLRRRVGVRPLRRGTEARSRLHQSAETSRGACRRT